MELQNFVRFMALQFKFLCSKGNLNLLGYKYLFVYYSKNRFFALKIQFFRPKKNFFTPRKFFLDFLDLKISLNPLKTLSKHLFTLQIDGKNNIF